MTFNAFPDLEAVVRKTLADANISGIGAHWYSSVPSEPEWPLGTVQRVGGLPAVRQYLDAASIQVDVWGNNKSEAFDIAAQARASVFGLEGTSISDPVDAWISGVEDVLGLSFVPDSITGRDRYLFGIVVYGRSFTS